MLHFDELKAKRQFFLHSSPVSSVQQSRAVMATIRDTLELEEFHHRRVEWCSLALFCRENPGEGILMESRHLERGWLGQEPGGFP